MRSTDSRSVRSLKRVGKLNRNLRVRDIDLRSLKDRKWASLEVLIFNPSIHLILSDIRLNKFYYFELNDIT
jgi:hypothetical protein